METKKKQKIIFELCSICIVKNALVSERIERYTYKEHARKAFAGEIKRALNMAGPLKKANPYHVSEDAYGYEKPEEGTHIAVWIREVKL